jgi:hypothetical protein
VKDRESPRACVELSDERHAGDRTAVGNLERPSPSNSQEVASPSGTRPISITVGVRLIPMKSYGRKVSEIQPKSRGESSINW